LLGEYYENLNSPNDLNNCDQILFNKLLDKYPNGGIYFKKFVLEFLYDTDDFCVLHKMLYDYSDDDDISENTRDELHFICYKVEKCGETIDKVAHRGNEDIYYKKVTSMILFTDIKND